MRKIRKLQLIVEKAENTLWGSVLVNDNLIVDSASSLTALENQFRKLVLVFEKQKDVQFEVIFEPHPLH